MGTKGGEEAGRGTQMTDVTTRFVRSWGGSFFLCLCLLCLLFLFCDVSLPMSVSGCVLLHRRRCGWAQAHSFLFLALSTSHGDGKAILPWNLDQQAG